MCFPEKRKKKTQRRKTKYCLHKGSSRLWSHLLHVLCLWSVTVVALYKFCNSPVLSQQLHTFRYNPSSCYCHTDKTACASFCIIIYLSPSLLPTTLKTHGYQWHCKSQFQYLKEDNKSTEGQLKLHERYAVGYYSKVNINLPAILIPWLTMSL